LIDLIVNDYIKIIFFASNVYVKQLFYIFLYLKFKLILVDKKIKKNYSILYIFIMAGDIIIATNIKNQKTKKLLQCKLDFFQNTNMNHEI